MTFVRADETAVFPRELDRAYPLVERAEGVWLYGADGKKYLDAAGGGAMVSSLGNGVEEIVEAAREQARRISFAYNQQFTSRPQEELARAVVALAPGDFARVHFTSGGAEANEAAVRLARAYHVDRGEHQRWRIVSPAQAYHGPNMRKPCLVVAARYGVPHHRRDGLPLFAVIAANGDVASR